MARPVSYRDSNDEIINIINRMTARQKKMLIEFLKSLLDNK